MDFNAETLENEYREEPVYKPFDNGFEKASSILGIISIITAFLGLGTIPMMLGGTAIILALLSRGKGSMGSKAMRGLTCGIIGLAINIFLICYVIMLFCTNVTYRDLINNQCRMMYGYTLNDVIEESVGDGFDLEEYLSR